MFPLLIFSLFFAYFQSVETYCSDPLPNYRNKYESCSSKGTGYNNVLHATCKCKHCDKNVNLTCDQNVPNNKNIWNADTGYNVCDDCNCPLFNETVEIKCQYPQYGKFEETKECNCKYNCLPVHLQCTYSNKWEPIGLYKCLNHQYEKVFSDTLMEKFEYGTLSLFCKPGLVQVTGGKVTCENGVKTGYLTVCENMTQVTVSTEQRTIEITPHTTTTPRRTTLTHTSTSKRKTKTSTAKYITTTTQASTFHHEQSRPTPDIADSDNNTADNKKLTSISPIILICIVIALLFFVILIISYICYKKRKQTNEVERKEIDNSDGEIIENDVYAMVNVGDDIRHDNNDLIVNDLYLPSNVVTKNRINLQR